MPAHIRVMMIDTKSAVRLSKNTSSSTGTIINGTMYMPPATSPFISTASIKNTSTMAKTKMMARILLRIAGQLYLMYSSSDPSSNAT